MNDNELNSHDLQSPLAGKLRRLLDDKRQSLRTRNESSLDAMNTAHVRGEIKAYKDLLNLLALSKRADQTTGADEEHLE